jgi:hypothetical protein
MPTTASRNDAATQRIGLVACLSVEARGTLYLFSIYPGPLIVSVETTGCSDTYHKQGAANDQSFVLDGHDLES